MPSPSPRSHARAHDADPPPEVDAHVALLRADPGFARGIPAADMALAQRVLVLPRLDLDAGRFTPPPRPTGAPTPLALVLDGLVGRHVALGDRVATQLLGPGDVFDPWSARGDALLPCSVRWSAFQPATLAVLDGRFTTTAQRWPALSVTAQERLAALGDRLAIHLAICQLPRVEDRVLALLWHLAERFGRVAPAGVVLDLRLTHRLIGELVGAQRPTVSLALSSLLEHGHVSRREDGTVVLDRGSRGALDPTGVPAPIGPAPRAPAPQSVPPADLMQRVRVLRSDLETQRARTIAAVARSASLRAARRGAERAEADGEAA
ncbi:MAG: family transcriptional regulator, cyclic receptor protein [Solirubrobacteraceae bacterium]|jgi:CRP-like cAMP-binding protein|nr:family transcriptional regulator, cyclic receptor protein [Solirubrobacteraceae bacterium]